MPLAATLAFHYDLAMNGIALGFVSANIVTLIAYVFMLLSTDYEQVSKDARARIMAELGQPQEGHPYEPARPGLSRRSR